MSVEVSKVSFSYGKGPILKEVSFQAKPGEIFAVMGPNGAGKSTLFRCILGLLAGYQGEILVGGCLLYTSPSPRDRQKSRMPSSA